MGEPLGLIAGNGRFPFLAAAGARRAGRRVVALAIREEAAPELEREVDEFHWVGLGQLGKAIEILHRAGAREAVMAGQVKHRQIFSGIVPDLKLMGVLARLAFQNTDSLIGAVADALAREGITLLPSTAFLGDAAGQRGGHDHSPPGPRRAARRRVRGARRARAGRDGPRPDGRCQGPGGGGARGHGGDRRDDPARRAARGTRHDRGQGLEARTGHALRRAGRGPGNARRHAGGRRARAGPGRGSHAADRPPGVPGAGRGRGNGSVGPGGERRRGRGKGTGDA